MDKERAYIKTATFALLMMICGMLGLHFTFGDSESLAWLILSKPIGVALLYCTYLCNEKIRTMIADIRKGNLTNNQ